MGDAQLESNFPFSNYQSYLNVIQFYIFIRIAYHKFLGTPLGYLNLVPKSQSEPPLSLSSSCFGSLGYRSSLLAISRASLCFLLRPRVHRNNSRLSSRECKTVRDHQPLLVFPSFYNVSLKLILLRLREAPFMSSWKVFRINRSLETSRKKKQLINYSCLSTASN